MGCSNGLHAGALNYVASYGSVESNDRIVIVKINPEDVVSVPSDCNCEKLRTCRYEVVGEYQGELLKPLYKSEFGEDDYHEDEGSLYDEYDENYWEKYDDDDEYVEDYDDDEY